MLSLFNYISNMFYKRDTVETHQCKLDDIINKNRHDKYMQMSNVCDEMKKICDDCNKYQNKYVDQEGHVHDNISGFMAVCANEYGPIWKRGECAVHGDILGDYISYKHLKD